MWMFTKVGFFSAVRAEGGKKMMVRARVAADLDQLRRTYAPSLTETVVSRHTDYPYRAFLAPREWAKACAAIALDVDYRNFKNEVTRQQGAARHNLYGRVWEVMYAAEEKLGIRPRRPTVTGDAGDDLEGEPEHEQP